jgi:NAD(P)H-dependent flavin oxidoreductase YrpB (nitropropane dioxygenase family)
VDSAGHTVLSLDIKLRGFIVGDSTVIHDITLGGGINHVADHETLSSLVLRDQVVALVAPNTINVTAAGLVASSVSSLLGHSTSFDK